MNDSERMRRFWLIAIPTSVFAVTIVLMAGDTCALPPANGSGGRCGNPFSNTLYDYQGLIAGAFAIFAAYLTVRTMRETDDRQELRHQELMRLNLRRDQLVARRAAYPQVTDMDECERGLEQIEKHLTSREYIAFVDDLASRQHNPLFSICRDLNDIISREQLTAVKELLDQEGYRAFQLLEKALKELERSNEVIGIDVSNYAIYGTIPTFPFMKRDKALNDLEATRVRLHQLSGSIASLAEEYE